MLRQFLLWLLVFCASTTLAGELRIITSGGLQGVADEAGQVVVPAIYERLGWSHGGDAIINESIGYFENGHWGLINIRTKKLTNARYATLRPFSDMYFEAGIAGRFSNMIFRGLIDGKSEVVLDFHYYTITDAGDHRLIVSEYKNGSLQYGLYSDQNVALIPTAFASMERKGNLILAGNRVQRLQIFDLAGNPLIDDWVDHVEESGEGYVVFREGYLGTLDKAGGVILPIRHKAITQGTATDFPSWEVKTLNGTDSRFFDCDSIAYEPETGLLIAHVNHAQHMLGASQSLFQDQQHTLKHIGHGFLVTRNNALQTWGIYKTDGREVAVGFDSVAVDQQYFFARSRSGWNIYNFFGRKLNERPFQDLGASHGGYVPVKKNESWGWVDFQGQKVIEYRYDAVAPAISGDHFLGNNFGKWGVGTFEDKWLIMPRYDHIFAYEDFYIASKGLATHLYTLDGNLLQELPYPVEAGDFLKVLDGSKAGAVTSAGYFIYPDYDSIARHGSYYELHTGDTLTMVSALGRPVLSQEDAIADVLSFSEGYFHIIKDGKHGFVDENGKLRIANRYDSAQQYQEGLAPVKLMGKWGFIDQAEILVVQPYYRYSSTFSNGLAVVQSGNQYGIIDQKGEEVVSASWKLIERLHTGNYRITDWDGKVGLADASGRFVVRPNYEQVQDTIQELIIASRSGKKGVLDYTGYTKVPFEYLDIKISGDYLLLRHE